MNCAGAETFIRHYLETGLVPTLTYHGLHHTLDVVQAAADLAEAEGITDPESLILLRTAAFYHDAGFVTTYTDHEAAGCVLTWQTLPDFGYSPAQIETICGLIGATRIPQEPHTHLEQILADADLDYLGRPDFTPIAQTLFTELQAHQHFPNDVLAWNRVQLNFLEHHRYWTRTAIIYREAPKQAHIAHLRQQV